MVNACPMCSVDGESVVHLIWNCRPFHSVWRSIVNWFDYSWAPPFYVGLLLPKSFKLNFDGSALENPCLAGVGSFHLK